MLVLLMFTNKMNWKLTRTAFRSTVCIIHLIYFANMKGIRFDSFDISGSFFIKIKPHFLWFNHENRQNGPNTQFLGQNKNLFRSLFIVYQVVINFYFFEKTTILLWETTTITLPIHGTGDLFPRITFWEKQLLYGSPSNLTVQLLMV